MTTLTHPRLISRRAPRPGRRTREEFFQPRMLRYLAGVEYKWVVCHNTAEVDATLAEIKERGYQLVSLREVTPRVVREV